MLSAGLKKPCYWGKKSEQSECFKTGLSTALISLTSLKHFVPALWRWHSIPATICSKWLAACVAHTELAAQAVWLVSGEDLSNLPTHTKYTDSLRAAPTTETKSALFHCTDLKLALQINILTLGEHTLPVHLLGKFSPQPHFAYFIKATTRFSFCQYIILTTPLPLTNSFTWIDVKLYLRLVLL